MTVDKQPTAPKTKNDTFTVDAADVDRYLRTHPDFFVDHRELLCELRVPHDSGGAISLVERQLANYRNKNNQLDKQLKDLLSFARNNERLGQLIHRFSLHLMYATSIEEIFALTRQTAMRDFRTEHIVIEQFDPDDALNEIFADLSASRSVLCGLPPRHHLEALFEDPDDIASMAMVFLHAKGEQLGVIVLGSSKPSTFHPNMGTIFLSRLGELVSHRLWSVATR